MRLSTGLALLICCCAAVTACTAAAPKGPNANVTVPSVGKPPAPASAQAALASEAFTPYAEPRRGLRRRPGPGRDVPGAAHRVHERRGLRPVRRRLAVRHPGQPTGSRSRSRAGPWGYVGVSLAQQYGFDTPGFGPDAGGPGDTFSSLPHRGARRRQQVLQHHRRLQRPRVRHLAGRHRDDEQRDQHRRDPGRRVQESDDGLVECMAKNGYTTPDANTFAQVAAATVSSSRARARARDQAPPRSRRQPRRPRLRSRWP